MKSFEASPLIGVGTVKLGMSRAEVHAVMGLPLVAFKKTPASAHATEAWHDNGFQVFYGGAEPVVEFIELSRGCGFEVVCLGLPVFATAAAELVEQFAAVSSFDPSDPELGCSYVFPALELALWRPVLEGPEGRQFSTIGVGRSGYFSDTNSSTVTGAR